MVADENIFADFKIRIRSLIDVNDQDLDAIVQRFEHRRYGKNDYILKQGGHCDFWGFVHKGLVRVYSYSEDGEEFTNGFCF